MNKVEETVDRIKMIYDGRLSVEENAEKCDVSVPTMRLWLRLNHVDRMRESMFLKYKAIKNLQKQHPQWSIRRMAKETSYANNTVRKYMAMDEFEKPMNQNKILSFDTSNSQFLIKSISKDQQEILNNIIKLYIPDGYIQCDFTFSIGVMYKDNKVVTPPYRFDKYPKQGIFKEGGVLHLDDVEKYLEDDTLNSCIVDLPFLITKKEWTENCKMHQRFNSFNDMKEATEVNKYMLQLSYAKLKKKGVMIMKTQDLYTAGRQIWMSHYVHAWAEEVGFKVIDKFILTSETRMLSSGMNQKCARKYHSYFFVFRK